MAAYQKGFPPQVIGNRVENKYLCSQCQRVLRNPVQSYCGHRFCRACVEALLSESETVLCPSCVQEHQHDDEELVLEQVFPDNATKRELYALPAKCPNEGCHWEGKLKEFEKHENECEFRQIECQCGEQFLPEEFDRHRSTECTFRLVSCPHCDMRIQYRMLETHQAECQHLPVVCPRCGEENILRMNLDAHMKMPKCTPHIRCPYGCGKLVEEAKLDEHLREDPRSHLDVMGQRIHELTIKVDQGASELQAAIETLSTTSGQGAVADEEAMDTGEAGAGANTHGNLVQQLNTVEQKVNMSEQFSIVLKRELEKNVRAVQELREERRVDGERIAALESSLNRLLGGGGGGVSGGIGGLPLAAAGIVATQAQQEPISTDGTLVWKITDFKQKKADAVSGVRLVLMSPPFYTSPSGYKLCARIYPNGDGVGKGTHVSVFLVIMKGPYDALLKWPFRQKVTMALQDQGPRQHHVVDSFRPDPSAASFQRPSTELNTASGCPMFVQQTTIWGTDEFQYVKDDLIFLKISVDTTGL